MIQNTYLGFSTPCLPNSFSVPRPHQFLLLQDTRRERCYLLIEQLLSPLPYRGVLPVIQGKQGRKQIVAELFRGLARQQRRKVVNRDDGQGRVLKTLNRNGGLIKRGRDSVDRHRVVRVSSVRRDIAHNRELAIRTRGLQRVHVHEVRDGAGQVDAVDEDVTLCDLLKGATLGGLGHVPLQDFVLGHTSLAEGRHRAVAAAAQGTYHDHLRQPSGLGCTFLECLLDIGNERVLVRVGRDARERLVGVSQLPRPNLQGQRGTSKACVEAECGNTSPPVLCQDGHLWTKGEQGLVLVISEELEIQ
jgi:hypothetical protein